MQTHIDKTLALVLSTVLLNDHTQLVHLYTQALGRVTCRIPVVSRGKKASRLRNMMTPMTLLDVVLGGRPSDRIRSISEANVVQSPYLLTLAHPDKATQCLFMAELIAHTVREEEANPRLWEFISGSLSVLENADTGWSNFHLVFTSGMIQLLGFSIDTESYVPNACFDMREGVFTTSVITHPFYLNAESAKWFCQVLELRYDTMHLLTLNHLERSALLDMLIAFLGQQIPEMGQLRSVEILKTLFN